MFSIYGPTGREFKGTLACADWRAQYVEAVMLTPIPSVSAQADMRRVAGALVDSGLPGLPVVDDEGRVIGFVSRTDVPRAALKDAGLDVWGRRVHVRRSRRRQSNCR